MHALRIALIMGFLSVSRPSRADPPSTPTNPPSGNELHVQLDNGLRVVIVRDPAVARVSVEMMYGVGSAEDPPGHHGLAHLTEHMLFVASRHVPHEGFARLLETSGADYNGVTGLDQTWYSETLPASQLPLALWLESERMAFAIERVTPDTVAAQRRVVLNEERQNRTDFMGHAFMNTVYETAFPAGHPYHQPFETLADIDAVRAPDVQWFLQRYYTPDDAVLAVVGNVDLVATRALVERYFGTIPRNTHPATVATPDPVTAARSTFVEFHLPSYNRRITIVWHAPPFLAPDDATLDVVARLLNDPVGRFQRRFFANHLSFRAMRARQDSSGRGALFWIDLMAWSLPRVTELFPDILRTLAELGRPAEREVIAARSALRWQQLARGEQSATRAHLVCMMAWNPDRTRTEETVRQRYDAITLDQVARVVREWLDPTRATVIYSVPDRLAPPEGERVRSTLDSFWDDGR